MGMLTSARVTGGVLVLAITTAACGGSVAATPDVTATRATEITQVAVIQATRTADSVTRTPTPMPSPELTATVAPTPTAVPTATPTPAPSSLLDKLPTLADMPTGFAMTAEEASLSTAEIASSYPDPNAQLDRLKQWGFAGSAFRSFSIPSPGLNDLMQRMVAFSAQVTRYGSPANALASIQFQIKDTMGRPGAQLSQVSVVTIGDQAFALEGSMTSENTKIITAILYVRQGNLLFRYQGNSEAYNSLNDAVSIATKTLR